MSTHVLDAVSHATPGSPEWLAARRNGLGASEVPAILGLDKYKSGLDIWLEKRGMAEPRGADTVPQRVGRFAEAMIASLYADATQLPIIQVPTVRHPSLSVLFASADRMVVDEQLQWLVPVEIKNRGGIPQGWGESGTDQIPEEVAVQVHVQMACYGLKMAHVAALLGGNDFRIYKVHQDTVIEADILETVDAWWTRHMVNGEEPPIEGPGAAGYLARKFSKVVGEVITADEMGDGALLAYATARAKVEAAKRDVEAFELILKNLIGENKGITGGAGKVLWSPTKGRTTTDHKAVVGAVRDWFVNLYGDAAAIDEVISEAVAASTITGPESRTFRFTPAKES